MVLVYLVLADYFPGFLAVGVVLPEQDSVELVGIESALRGDLSPQLN